MKKKNGLRFFTPSEKNQFLFKNKCQIIIIACNTATARALRQIQQKVLPNKYPDKKVLGVIVPILEKINEDFVKPKTKKIKTVGVIGTIATIKSGAYKKELDKINDRIKTVQIACPLLVPLIENKISKEEDIKKVVKQYLEPLKKKQIEVLVLACTHYPFILDSIKKEIGEKTMIINSPRIVSEKLFMYFKKHPEIKQKLSKKNKIVYLLIS